MTRLWEAYQQALMGVLSDHSNLPLEFSYEEEDPPVERIVCRLWDRRSFVLHPDHIDKYHDNTVALLEKNGIHLRTSVMTSSSNMSKQNSWEENISPEGLWFTDLLKLGMLSFKPRVGTKQEVAKKQAWLRQWGYGED